MRLAMAGVALAVVAASMIGVNVFLEDAENERDINLSDSGTFNHSYTMAMDGWIGYSILCSNTFKSRLRDNQIRWSCENDDADLEDRFKRLKNGDIDFAVTTVDAYLSLGQDYDFPGVVIAVIDQSKGGDAIVAWSDEVKTVNDLANANGKMAYIADTPSEHFLRAIRSHFALDKKGQTHTKGTSEEVLAAIKNKDVHSAVLWEPYVTKALAVDGIEKVISTAEVQGVIVDILLVNKSVLQHDFEQVKTVLDQYFQTVDIGRVSPNTLINDVVKTTGIEKSEVSKMMSGVEFSDFNDNAIHWFPMHTINGNPYTRDSLYDVINRTTDLLGTSGVTVSLPDNNPYRLIASKALGEILTDRKAAGTFIEPEPEPIVFEKLSDAEWDQLKVVGKLKTPNVQFSNGRSELSLTAKQTLDAAVEDLKHYPSYRLLIKGHTSTSGDAEANLELSSNRAKFVERYFTLAHGIHKNRVKAVGVGGNEPLAREPGETFRAFKYRLPRVELILLRDGF
ncbi:MULTISPECIES: OmpA family protein [Vibrio]|uniref:OmpA family protein n=1 Tax=Vibrio TaxID=662 RepID=UPI00078DA7DB|nr:MULTISPECIES: phosphate ABC transporter substrate-binding/OmpA family protein [Vibrio]BAU70958.1 hypothetical protein [Vibrio sp. 04Ya108]BBM67784.1 hypothetical protein VA249_44300 [Vibrio alfacsensis]BCN26955.1 hypothetical protein VYA_41470 [Vibrio alfacsensis]